MSESMFQSLRHPSVGIESARWEETCKALLRFIWNNRSYLFDPIQTRITLGGTFEPPVRWLNRSSINTALNKHVVDISAGADEEAVGGQEDFVEDEEEQDVSALGPRAAEWIKAVDDAEIAENAAKAKEKGKGRAKAKAPESEAPAKDSRAPPKSGPVNLAKYAAVLDEVGEPLPMKIFYARGDKATLAQLLKSAKLTAESIITTESPSDILELIIRTPMRWADYAAHGAQDMVTPWIIGSILELAAINLYRRELIEDHVGGYLRQLLEKVLSPFMPGSLPKFPWPDRLRNDNELAPLDDPSSEIAKVETESTKYRHQAMQELSKIMSRIHDSFIAVSTKEFDMKAPAQAKITPEVSFALKSLNMVSVRVVLLFNTCVLILVSGPAVEYRAEHFLWTAQHRSRRWY